MLSWLSLIYLIISRVYAILLFCKATVDIPLSYLTEELQVVQLDNRDEALVGGWVRTTVK